MTQLTLPTLAVAPAQVVRGSGILKSMGDAIARLGTRPIVIRGDRSLLASEAFLAPALVKLTVMQASYGHDCSEPTLQRLSGAIAHHQADVVIGVGGGKALDTAKLVAHQAGLPVVTIPTSAATCAAWTALSNVYSEAGAFRYDVPLDRCPDLLILDIAMPVIDGYELLRRFRRHSKLANVPAIVVSARAGTVDQQRVLQLFQPTESRIDAYVGKPFNPAHLLQTVKNVLANHKDFLLKKNRRGEKANGRRAVERVG